MYNNGSLLSQFHHDADHQLSGDRVLSLIKSCQSRKVTHLIFLEITTCLRRPSRMRRRMTWTLTPTRAARSEGLLGRSRSSSDMALYSIISIMCKVGIIFGMIRNIRIIWH